MSRQQPRYPYQNVDRPRLRCVINGYSPISYHSEYIKDEDVVRPPNHKYTTREDRVTRGYNNWLYKSIAHHQTYSTCEISFDSGPVMTKCSTCKNDNHVYQVFKFGGAELDSGTLSLVLDRGLKKQKAHQEGTACFS
jgi:hypothetical protein